MTIPQKQFVEAVTDALGFEMIYQKTIFRAEDSSTIIVTKGESEPNDLPNDTHRV